MVSPRPQLAALAGFLALLCAEATALEPLHAVAPAPPRAAGIAQRSVRTIAQTPDGFLWLGTEAGLLRFDGVQYERFSRREHPALPSDRIYDLVVDGPRLWVGTSAGVAVFEGGQLHPVAERPRGTAGGVALRGGGALFGIERHDVVTTRDTPLAARLAAAATTTLRDPLYDEAGDLWLGESERARLHHFSTTGHEAIATPPSRIPGRVNRRAKPLAALPGGGVLAADSEGLLRVVAGRATRVGPRELVAHVALRLRDGTWLVSTERQGLLRLDARFRRVGAVRGVLPGRVLCLFQDRDGRVWAGTNNHGLRRVSSPVARSVALPRAATGQSVAVATPDADGGLWVSVPCHGVSRMVDGREEQHVGEALGNTCVWAVAEHPTGTMWIGTWGAGLSRYDRRARRVEARYGAESGLGEAVLAILPEGGRGGPGMWVGGPSGLFHREGRRFVRTTGPRHVISLGQDPAGRLWAAGESGLWVRRGQRFHPLAEGPVRDAWFAPSGRALLATYGRGLLRYVDGGVSPVPPRIGVEERFLGQLFEGDGADLWVSSNRGLFRFDPLAALGERDAERQPVHLTAADGLPDTECNGGSGSAGFVAEGGLWVPTLAGVARVDLARAGGLRRAAPTPLIRAVRAGRRTWSTPPSRLRLRAGERNVEISFTAFDYDTPHALRFRYRVVDKAHGDAWIEVGKARTILLARLAPGEHRFQIQAAAPGGAWAAPATLTLDVQPLWFEAPWLRGLAGLLAALALLAWWQWTRRRHAFVQALVEARTQELASANAALAAQAQQDALTGLANRRGFEARLALCWRDAERNGTSVALIMIDIDHFKALNDTHGHVAGDRCLQEVARRLSSGVHRAYDLVARHGGEEFAVLLPGADLASAADVAERLRRAVSARPVALYAEREATVTISAGVHALVPMEGASSLGLLEAADAALYRAKAAGRDRVATSDMHDAGGVTGPATQPAVAPEGAGS